MAQPGKDETWLQALSTSLGVLNNDPRPLLSLSSSFVSSIQQRDELQANLLLAQASEIRRTGERKTAGSGKMKKDKWTYEDYCGVLTEIIRGGTGSVGVVESIWTSFQLQKPKKARTGHFARRQQATDDETDGLMLDMLTSTLNHKRVDMLQVLAHFASSEVVSRILPSAIRMRSLRSVQVLLEENADPNVCPEDFIDCVEAGEDDFIRLLLQSQTPVAHLTVTAALPAAAKRGSVDIVQLLLVHGADADAENGLAMEHAVYAGRIDLALSLLLAPNPPSPPTMAPILSYAFFKLNMHSDKKYNLIEVLLNGGAIGGSVSLALTGAVRQNWRELVQLFVDKGVSINSYGAEAYRYAVYEVDFDMIRILNRGHLEDDLATDIFKELHKTKHGASISPDDWRTLAELILDQGTSGQVMDEALVERVKVGDLESVQMLLRNGASADYSNGRALDEAVLLEQLDFIRILLENQPSALSLNTVFPRVEHLSYSVQLAITRMLLAAGANGAAVDKVLDGAMSPLSGRRDLEFIRILVDGGADVCQRQGDLLRLCVQVADIECLQIMLLGSPSPEFLSTCIPVAMQLSEQQRYRILDILLKSGARGPQVSQALVDSIDGSPSSSRVAALLLTSGEGDTSFGKGQAFKKSLSSNNLEYLELLVQHNHLTDSDFCSCLLFAIDLPRADDARLEKIRLLLSSGADMSGDTGTAALRHEMQGLKRKGEETLGVLHLILDAGASVNNSHGRILLDAMEMGLFECFKLYLGQHPSFKTLDSCFEKALGHTLRTFDLRYIHELLKVGMPQTTIDKALLRASEEDGNQPLALLLLKHGASINYQEGSAVRKAISRLDIGLLSHLLEHEPNAITLENAFTLSMTLTGAEGKFETFRLLLQAGAIPKRLLDEALVAAADGGWKMAAVCELLLQHQASASYANGTPLCRAIKSPDYKINLLKLLLRYGASDDAIAGALPCAFETLQGAGRLGAVDLLLTVAKPQAALDQLLLRSTQEPVSDRDLIKSLLRSNASVLHQDGQCLLQTVMKRDIDTLAIFEPYFMGNTTVASKVFSAAWAAGTQVQSQREEAVLTSLLKAGAKGESVDIALVESIKTYKSRPTVFSFIASLLAAGADVNYNHGISLVEASSQANLPLLRALFACSPGRKNLTRAFPRVFRSGANSPAIREAVVAFCSHSSPPDLKYQSPNSGPILWQMLKNYPSERELLRYLIDAGCTVDPIVQTPLSQTSGQENVSLLCWALAQPRDTLPDDIVDVLVSSGADVKYRTAASQRTPLQLAILMSRTNAVSTLLRFGADPSLEFPSGLSPLSLASSLGNPNVVRQLIDAGAFLNDGSLHEAARKVNVGVIRVLVKERSQRDYPCSRFQGRTALAELCMGAKNQPISQVKEAMFLLKDHGDFRRKSNGKSVLHFALDNENAVLITQALLDTFMSEFINAEFNLYEDGRFRYSPLAYVVRCRDTASAEQREALVDLLRQFECRDRFWAIEGDQPPDVIGAPEEIVEQMKYQRRRQARIQEEDEDHKRRLAQRRAEQAEDLASTKTRHDLTLQNQREAASQAAQIEEETAVRHATIATRRYDAELAYMREVTDLTNRRRDDQNLREIEHRKNIGLLEQGQRDENYNHEKTRREEEFGFLERREKLLTSAYEDRARIDKERFGDQLRLLEAQKEATERYQTGMAQIDYKPDSLD